MAKKKGKKNHQNTDQLVTLSKVLVILEILNQLVALINSLRD